MGDGRHRCRILNASDRHEHLHQIFNRTVPWMADDGSSVACVFHFVNNCTVGPLGRYGDRDDGSGHRHDVHSARRQREALMFPIRAGKHSALCMDCVQCGILRRSFPEHLLFHHDVPGPRRMAASPVLGGRNRDCPHQTVEQRQAPAFRNVHHRHSGAMGHTLPDQREPPLLRCGHQHPFHCGHASYSKESNRGMDTLDCRQRRGGVHVVEGMVRRGRQHIGAADVAPLSRKRNLPAFALDAHGKENSLSCPQIGAQQDLSPNLTGSPSTISENSTVFPNFGFCIIHGVFIRNPQDVQPTFSI